MYVDMHMHIRMQVGTHRQASLTNGGGGGGGDGGDGGGGDSNNQTLYQN